MSILYLENVKTLQVHILAGIFIRMGILQNGQKNISHVTDGDE